MVVVGEVVVVGVLAEEVVDVVVGLLFAAEAAAAAADAAVAWAFARAFCSFASFSFFSFKEGGIPPKPYMAFPLPGTRPPVPMLPRTVTMDIMTAALLGRP